MLQCHWPPCRSSWISISKLRDYSEQCMHSARGRWTWTLDPGQEAIDRSIVASAWIISNSDGARAATIVRGACLHMAGRWWQALFAATAGGSLEPAGRRPWVLAAKLTVVPPFHACATGRPASDPARPASWARTNVRLRYYSYSTSLLVLPYGVDYTTTTYMLSV